MLKMLPSAHHISGRSRFTCQLRKYRGEEARISSSGSRRCAEPNDGGFIRPFELERYFAKVEFEVPHLLCASDCEPLRMDDLLENADSELKKMWQELSLSYTTPAGLQVLREAITPLYTTVQVNNLLVAAPEELIFLAMSTLLKPGDTIIVTFPGYQSLYEVARSRGVNVMFWQPRYMTPTKRQVPESTTEAIQNGNVSESGSTNGKSKPSGSDSLLSPTANDGHIDASAQPSDRVSLGQLGFQVDDLKELAAGAQNLAMVVINFPHNPTGATLSETEMRQVAQVAEEKDCWLFSDEMYRGLEANHKEPAPSAIDLPEAGDRTIALGGMSKVYSCPGLRVGWLASHNEHALQQIQSTKDYTTICNSAPSEVLATMALHRHAELTQRSRDIVLGNIAVASRAFSSLDGFVEWHPPQGSSIAFPRLTSTDASVEEWSGSLLRESGVAVLPASVYQHPTSLVNNHFRIGLGRSDFALGIHALRKHVQDELGIKERRSSIDWMFKSQDFHEIIG